MTLEALRLLARAHAIAAWLATGALVAAAAALLGGAPRRRLAIRLGVVAALAATLAGGLGLLLDEPYRARLRQRLFLQAPGLGWLFERKLHLGFAAVLLAWSGLAALAALARARGESAPDLERAAKLAWLAAALLALVASIASVIVARRTHF